jgi:hypothetical protein
VHSDAFSNPSDSTSLRAFPIIIVVSDNKVWKTLKDCPKEFSRRMASILPSTANGPDGPDDPIEFRVI